MKKLFVLILVLLMLSGCSKGYSKYFPEPVDFEYLNNGKEMLDMVFLGETEDNITYGEVNLSFSENRLLEGLLSEYEFEHVIPGKTDGKNGDHKYGFKSTLTDNPVPGTKAFYLGLGENLVSAGVTEIGVYENGVYLFIDVEPCENPEDFSSEEFDFGPNFLFFASYDKELIDKLDALYEKVMQRAPMSVELSDEEFVAYAKEIWGYTDEQLELCFEANVPKTRILRPFAGEYFSSYVDSTVDGKYSLGLFGYGAAYRLKGEQVWEEDLLYIPYLTDTEIGGKTYFIPEVEFKEEDYNFGFIDNERFFFLTEDSLKIYSAEPLEVIHEVNLKKDEKTVVFSAFSVKENERIYVFKAEDYEFFNDSFGDPDDYSKYYKIDVFEKDGSFVKTIETGVPIKSYYKGKNGLASPKQYGGTTAGKENILYFDIYYESFCFDYLTEEFKRDVPENVKISAKKGESGKYYLEKDGKAISFEIYDSINIEKSIYYENEKQKTAYYAVCAFEDGTDMRLFRNSENPRKPHLLEVPNIRFDIYLEDGTLINEKPVQNFSFYACGDGEFWNTEPNTLNLRGYSDNCQYHYVKPTDGTGEFKLTVEKAEDKINEYGFTITEKYYPGFYGRNGKIYGVKNPSGKVIAETVYLNVEMPFEDRIILKTGDDWDYTAGETGYPIIIDTEGKVLSDEFDNLWFEFSDDGRYIGIALKMIYKEDGNWTRFFWIIDKDGNKLFEIKMETENYLYISKIDFENEKLTISSDYENYYEYEIGDYIQNS